MSASPRVKQPRNESGHLPPTGVGVRSARSHTFHPHLPSWFIYLAKSFSSNTDSLFEQQQNLVCARFQRATINFSWCVYAETICFVIDVILCIAQLLGTLSSRRYTSVCLTLYQHTSLNKMFRGEMQTYTLLQRLPSIQRDQSIITYTFTAVRLGIPFFYLPTYLPTYLPLRKSCQI
jgi:hypothetical protein